MSFPSWLRIKNNSTNIVKNIDEIPKTMNIPNFGLKLLVISDCHDSLDKDLLDQLALEEYDICLLLGDNTKRDINYIKQIVPVEKIYAILGNHDGLDLLKQCGIKSLHQNVIDIHGVKIAGFQGSNRYKYNDYVCMYTHEESERIAEEIPFSDILISHDKPFDENEVCDDAHCGLTGITKYINKHNIKINIHGHLHEEYIKDKTNYREICVYGCRLIEI